MFGTDTTPRREAFRIYYRFLETDDEYFDCAASHHLQGFWMIYGVFLPDEVLEKVYHKNAERLLYAAAEPAEKPIKGPAAATQVRQAPPKPAMKTLHVQAHRRFRDYRRRQRGGLEEGRMGAAVAARRPPEPARRAVQDALFQNRAVRADDRHGQEADGHARRGFSRPVERGRVRVLPLARRNGGRSISSTKSRPWATSCRSWSPTWTASSSAGGPGTTRATARFRKPRRSPAAKRSPAPTITGWTAEVFVPYELLEPLGQRAAQAGHALAGQLLPRRLRRRPDRAWDWSRVGPSFHEFEKFGTLVFE